MTDLAERVGLSAAVHRKSAPLGKTGVIQGYYARLDPKAMDLPCWCLSKSSCPPNLGNL